MGQIFFLPMPAVTVTSAGGNTDLLTIAPASGKTIKLHRLFLGQTSELGDAAEEAMNLSIIRFPATVSGDDGTSGTVASVNDLQGSAGVTFRYNDTGVITTSGTAVTLVELAWNMRGSPLELVFPNPIYIRNAAVLAIRMTSSLTDDATIMGTAEVEEE